MRSQDCSIVPPKPANFRPSYDAPGFRDVIRHSTCSNSIRSNGSPEPKIAFSPQAAMTTTSSENSSKPRVTSALRVAVADDDRSARELLVQMLCKQGHEVV